MNYFKNIKKERFKLFIFNFISISILYISGIYYLNANIFDINSNFSKNISIITSEDKHILSVKDSSPFTNYKGEKILELYSEEKEISEHLEKAKWQLLNTNIHGVGSKIELKGINLKDKVFTIFIEIELEDKKVQLFDTISTYSDNFDFINDGVIYLA